jgi:hypothetical protein
VSYLPLHVTVQRLIAAYLKAAGHTEDLKGPLFRPIKNNVTKTLAKPLHPVCWVGTRRVALRHVSSSPPLRTVLEAFTSHGSAPLITLGVLILQASCPLSPAPQRRLSVYSLRVRWVP